MKYKKSTAEVDGMQQWKKTDSSSWFHMSINQPCDFGHQSHNARICMAEEKHLCFVLKKQRNLMLRNRKKKLVLYQNKSQTIFLVNCWLCFRCLPKTQITSNLYPILSSLLMLVRFLMSSTVPLQSPNSLCWVLD